MTLDKKEIAVRRVDGVPPRRAAWLAAIEQHLATAEPHPADTTDRLLEADRRCPY
jgi:hypothetical protein